MRSSRFDRVRDIAGADDDSDRWGWAMNLFFDVASVLDMSDIECDVTLQPFDRWQYQRAQVAVPDIETVAARADDFTEGEYADDYTYGEVALAVAVRDGDLTQADLIYAGDVLDRYTSLLRLAGMDY